MSASNDGEDSEDSLPINDDLDDFRSKWQKELKNDKKTVAGGDISQSTENPPFCLMKSSGSSTESEKESVAEKLFKQGVEFEKQGKVYDALRFYRRAVQVVPDIEFKIYESAKLSMVSAGSENNNNGFSESLQDQTNDNLVDQSDDEDLSNVDLKARFNLYLAKSGYLVEKGIATSGAHISDLPMEILLYVLRWVVSSQLDIRSLEQCSAVCKGLFVCARDEEIWRLACLKIWGVNTGLLKSSPYLNWRQMYMERSRVLFHGCYISKTSYLRYGENSFQDQFYRPIQLIEYFRYVRFFADGQILMMTSADEPSQSVGKLKNPNQLKPEVLKGHYRLHGDLVIIVLKRNAQPQLNSGHHKRKPSNVSDSDSNGINTFYLELKIVNTSKKKLFYQLQWQRYSIIQIKNKREVSTEFELTQGKYPPLWFSRVKSYHLEAESPLQ